VARDLRVRKGQLLRRERELRQQRQAASELEADLQRQREALQEAQSLLAAKQAEVDRARQEARRLLEEENARLERVAGMTQEEARRQLLANLKAEVRHEAATLIREIKEDAQRRADAEAVKIISLAIERAASELGAERTVYQLQIPRNPQLRGRIIGQEGKNIRAFERATGIQLLMEDDSETVVLSGFNPIRREIARRVLEALIRDGAVSPRRIEELVRRHGRRLEEEMRRAGEDVVRELGLRDIHPELVRLLGRLLYRTSYGQNVLAHSKEVAYLTGMMAAELRLDEKLARRAGLLHDIGKAVDYEREGTHPEIGAEVASRYGEPEVVVNAIASHHEDCEVLSPISVLVAAADALSGARPGARRKSVAEYIRRIAELESLAQSVEGVDQCYAIQAGRELRVIANSKAVGDEQVGLLASELASRIQSAVDFPGKIKVTVIREVRAVDYAR
jgi:ribonuclease Y